MSQGVSGSTRDGPEAKAVTTRLPGVIAALQLSTASSRWAEMMPAGADRVAVSESAFMSFFSTASETKITSGEVVSPQEARSTRNVSCVALAGSRACLRSVPWHMVRCPTCGTRFAGRAPSDAELDAHYRGYGDWPDSTITRQRYRELLSSFASYRGNGRVFDMGCGPGYFLEEAAALGWSPHGSNVGEKSMRCAVRRAWTLSKLRCVRVSSRTDILMSSLHLRSSSICASPAGGGDAGTSGQTRWPSVLHDAELQLAESPPAR